MTEIFFNTELNDVCFETESLDEWKSITKELGLEKQADFVKVADSPIPYPHINESMERIFSTLCPCKVDHKEYSKTPIPLDVLKQLSYSVKEGHFKKYEIWYDDVSPDPFLIGIRTHYTCYYKVENVEISAKKEDSNWDTIQFVSQEAAEEWCINNDKVFVKATLDSWMPDRYLIARWADVKRSIPELKELAKERIIEQYGKVIKENAILYLNGSISESQLKGK